MTNRLEKVYVVLEGNQDDTDIIAIYADERLAQRRIDGKPYTHWLEEIEVVYHDGVT